MFVSTDYQFVLNKNSETTLTVQNAKGCFASTVNSQPSVRHNQKTLIKKSWIKVWDLSSLLPSSSLPEVWQASILSPISKTNRIAESRSLTNRDGFTRPATALTSAKTFWGTEKVNLPFHIIAQEVGKYRNISLLVWIQLIAKQIVWPKSNKISHNFTDISLVFWSEKPFGCERCQDGVPSDITSIEAVWLWILTFDFHIGRLLLLSS